MNLGPGGRCFNTLGFFVVVSACGKAVESCLKGGTGSFQQEVGGA